MSSWRRRRRSSLASSRGLQRASTQRPSSPHIGFSYGTPVQFSKGVSANTHKESA
jgi:hypothetical protein